MAITAIVQPTSARYQGTASNTNVAETVIELPNKDRLNFYIKTDSSLYYKRQPAGGTYGAETLIGACGPGKFLDTSMAPDGTVYVCVSIPDVHISGTIIGIIVYKGATNGTTWTQFFRQDSTMSTGANTWSDTRYGCANVTAFNDAVFVGIQYHALTTDATNAVLTSSYSLAIRKLKPSDGTQIAPNSGLGQASAVGWTAYKVIPLADRLRVIQADTLQANSRNLLYMDSTDGLTGQAWGTWTALATLSDPVADVGARNSIVMRANQQSGGTNDGGGAVATSSWSQYDTYQQIGDGGYIFHIAGYIKAGATTGWFGPMYCYSTDNGATWSTWRSLYWTDGTDLRAFSIGQVVQNSGNPGPGYWKAVMAWSEGASNTWLGSYEVNQAPQTPTLTTPTNGARVEPGSVTLDFIATIGDDFENDVQHFEWKFATDTGFTTGLVSAASATIQTGWSIQKPGATIWDAMPIAGATSDYEGGKVKYTYSFTAASNQNYYWQMRPRDMDTNGNHFGLWSNPFNVLGKNSTLIMTLRTPISTTAAAKRMVISALWALATDGTTPASIKIEACNNGNDATPTWEDMTTQFRAKQAYNLTNATKTDASWAVNVRLTILTNDSTGISYIDGFGLSFD